MNRLHLLLCRAYRCIVWFEPMLRAALWLWLCLAVLTKASTAVYYGNYYCRAGRDVVVQLFEWKWTDIETECSWLAQHDYCAVQVRRWHCYSKPLGDWAGALLGLVSRSRIIRPMSVTAIGEDYNRVAMLAAVCGHFGPSPLRSGPWLSHFGSLSNTVGLWE